MKDTSFGTEADELAALYVPRPGTQKAVRHDGFGAVGYGRPDCLSGGGGLVSTAADYNTEKPSPSPKPLIGHLSEQWPPICLQIHVTGEIVTRHQRDGAGAEQPHPVQIASSQEKLGDPGVDRSVAVSEPRFDPLAIAGLPAVGAQPGVFVAGQYRSPQFPVRKSPRRAGMRPVYARGSSGQWENPRPRRQSDHYGARGSTFII
jgi:hypothetical protein